MTLALNHDILMPVPNGRRIGRFDYVRNMAARWTGERGEAERNDKGQSYLNVHSSVDVPSPLDLFLLETCLLRSRAGCASRLLLQQASFLGEDRTVVRKRI